jgi:hypothetical protein
LLVAHNRRYRNDMVGTGGVAHAEKEAKNNNGKQGDHYFRTAETDRECERQLSRNSKYSVIPSPVLADSLKTSIPGRT